MKKIAAVTSLFALISCGVGDLLAAESWLARAAGAPLQVVAICQSRASHWEGGSIFTDSDISVLRVVQGSPDLTMVVRQRGGEVDGIGQKVSHAKLLEPGKSYLLFLSPAPDGSWSPTSKGVNPIEAAVDLVERVAGDPLEQVLAELGGGA